MPTAAIAALAVLTVATMLARRSVESPVVARLRALFPSWRFFDRVTESPRLLVRTGAPGARLGPWTPIEGARRDPLRFVFAPASNLALAYHAVVEHLVGELGELELPDAAPAPIQDGDELGIETAPEVTNLVSYELVTRIARAHVPSTLRGVPGARLQWKVIVPGQPAPKDYLVSPELPA